MNMNDDTHTPNYIGFIDDVIEACDDRRLDNDRDPAEIHAMYRDALNALRCDLPRNQDTAMNWFAERYLNLGQS